MKRGEVMLVACGILLVSLILLVSAVNVSAIGSDIKPGYKPGETVVVEISGIVLEPIILENVKIKKENVEIATDLDVQKLGEKYYVWFIAPQNANNYTLLIKNLNTMINGIPKIIDFSQNFTITGNFTDYNINPGFIFAREDFKIKVKLFEDNNKIISRDFPYAENIVLKPGDNEIYFSISNIAESEFLTIHLGKYSIPAYIIKNESSLGSITIKFVPRTIERIIYVRDKLPVRHTFIIANTGKDEIKNIYFSYNNNTIEMVNNNFDLKSGESLQVNFSIIRAINSNEIIYAKYGNYSIELPVKLRYDDNVSNIAENKSGSANDLYKCLQLNGKVCPADQVCSVNTLQSLDGPCCIGECSSGGTSGGSSWIGYLIAAIAAIGVIYLFMKYRKTKPVGNPLQAFTGESKRP